MSHVHLDPLAGTSDQRARVVRSVQVLLTDLELLLGQPIDEHGHGWSDPRVWASLSDADVIDELHYLLALVAEALTETWRAVDQETRLRVVEALRAKTQKATGTNITRKERQSARALQLSQAGTKDPGQIAAALTRERDEERNRQDSLSESVRPRLKPISRRTVERYLAAAFRDGTTKGRDGTT